MHSATSTAHPRAAAASPAMHRVHGGAQRPLEWAGTISRCDINQYATNKTHVLTAMDAHIANATIPLPHEQLRTPDVRVENYPLTEEPLVIDLYQSLTHTHTDEPLVAFMQAFLSCHDGDFYDPVAPQDTKENRMCLVYGVIQKDALAGFPLLTALLEKAEQIDAASDGNVANSITNLIHDMRPVQIASPFNIDPEQLVAFLTTLNKNASIDQNAHDKAFTETVLQAIGLDPCSTLAYERLIYLLTQLHKLNPTGVKPRLKTGEQLNLINEIKFILDPTQTRSVIYKVPTLSLALTNLKFNTGPLLDHFLKDTMGCLVYYMDGKQQDAMDHPSFSATVDRFYTMTQSQHELNYIISEVLFNRSKKELDFVDKKNLQSVLISERTAKLTVQRNLNRVDKALQTANDELEAARREAEV